MIEPALLCGGRYELGPVIGSGGMAEVRSGRDTRLDRQVAVKLLRPEVAHQPGVRSRFEAEARLAARLSHPNVVAVYDSGETDGVPFIVMERLPGQTLHDRLRGGPLPVEEVRSMARQVLAALQAAHDAGVLHRDIKPGNVMLTAGGGWKVGDFGIAQALEIDHQDLTATGLLIGTPAYLAPERFFGSKATVASDLYAVGVVLYEALTACKPFVADRADAWASLAAGAAAPPLDSLRAGVDPALAAAVDRAMARDPSARFRSAAEMASALDGTVIPAPTPIAAPRRSSAAPDSPWGEPPTGPGPSPTSGNTRPAATEVLPHRERRHLLATPSRAGAGGLGGRVAAGAAALVALAVAVILAVALSSGGRGGTAAPTGPSTSSPAAASPSAPGAGVAGASASRGTLPGPLDRALQNLQRQVTPRR